MISEAEPEIRPSFPPIALGGACRNYAFVPAKDITAYELAECMKLVNLGPMLGFRMIPPQALDDCFDSFSDEVRRHFKVQERSSIVLARG